MRIAELQLLAIGPFTNKVVDLSQGEAGFHIIYGPNEAGKTSCLRAITSWLFGFDTRRDLADEFVHPPTALRVGGTLITRDGSEIGCIRRRGNTKSLRGLDDRAEISPQVLSDLLADVTRQEFELRFGISHAQLVAGGAEIVAGKGRLGEVLFAAGAGIQHLQRLRESLQTEAEELFKKNGKNQLITMTLKRWGDCQLEMKDAQLTRATYDDLQARLATAEANQDRSTQRLATLRCDWQMAERHRQAFPAVMRRQTLLEELAKLPQGVSLPVDFAPTFRQLQEDLQRRQFARQSQEQQLAGFAAELQTTATSDWILAQQQPIERLHAEVQKYIDGVAEMHTLLLALENEEREARHQLQEVRGERGLALADLQLDRTQRSWIRRLITEHAALLQQLEQKQLATATFTAELQALTPRASINPLELDVTSVRAELEVARRWGDVSQLTDQKRQAIEALEVQVEQHLGRLSFWRGSAAEFQALRAPGLESIEAAREQWQAWQDRLTRLADELEEADEELLRLDHELEQLKLQWDVLTEADLAELRAARNATWQQLRSRWFPTADPALALSAAAGGGSGDAGAAEVTEELAELSVVPLAEQFEQQMAAADHGADRLRREAERVAHKATLLAQRQQLQQRRQRWLKDRDAAYSDQAELQARWLELWRDLPVTPGNPREMLTWHQLRTQLLGQLDDLTQRRLQQADWLRQLDRQTNRLRVVSDALQGRYPELLVGSDLSSDLPGNLSSDLNAELSALARHSQKVARPRAPLAELPQAESPAAGSPNSELVVAAFLAERDRAERICQIGEELQRSWIAAQKHRESLSQKLAAAAAEENVARDKWATWESQWEIAIAGFAVAEGRPDQQPLAPPEIALVLEAWEGFQGRQSKIDGHRNRLAQIAADQHAFRQRWSHLSAEWPTDDPILARSELLLSQDDEELGPALRVQRAFQALDAARSRHAHRRHLEQQCQSLRERSAADQLAEEQVQAELLRRCQLVDRQTPAEVEIVLRHAVDRQRVEVELREVEEKVRELAGATPLTTFVEQLVSRGEPYFASLTETLRLEIEATERELGDTREVLGGLRKEREQLRGDATAADLQQLSDELLAKVAEDAERYVELKLASHVLDQSIERYRQRHQGPVLAYASDWFRKLTMNAYSDLQTDFAAAGAEVLVGVRATDRKMVTVEGMSDGTRDQLYLALRLASLQHDLEQREPIPFIVDDVLVHFDDQRATAALRALAHFSRHTQAIFFTHHEHLLEIVRRDLANEEVFIHHLQA